MEVRCFQFDDLQEVSKCRPVWIVATIGARCKRLDAVAGVGGGGAGGGEAALLARDVVELAGAPPGVGGVVHWSGATSSWGGASKYNVNCEHWYIYYLQ